MQLCNTGYLIITAGVVNQYLTSFFAENLGWFPTVRDKPRLLSFELNLLCLLPQT